MKKRLVSLLCATSIALSSSAGAFPAFASMSNNNIGDSKIVESSDIPLRLWYDEPAPITDTENSPNASSEFGGSDVGWAEWSLPIGNGYFGANVFGRTETERIQITEKTLVNNFGDSTGRRLVGGLNNFSETYIDFGHTNVSDYIRYLDMKTAISGVEYTSGGVRYTREYFVSYPDKAIVIRMDADTDGALSFTLRPTVPYKQDFRATEGDGGSKTGAVDSYVENGVGTVELYGQMGVYDIDFLGLYKVYTDGGTVTASTAENTYVDTAGVSHTDTNGTIVVDGARSAYIVITLGTDYELSSDMFTAANSAKPTTKTDLEYTRAKVEADMAAIDDKLAGVSFDEGYELLRADHISDHSGLFGRVTVDLGCDEADFSRTTDILLENYKNGALSTYLETLMFQYGRYLLIASSREGTLPANLQGVWNTYNNPPWGSGYWFNINIQMNYWHAFSTNLAETFTALTSLMDAYMEKLESVADSNIQKYYPELYDKDGGNGWSISTGNFPYTVGGDRSAGNLGFTTQLYWEYYEFTRDPEALQTVYDILINAAKYITKIVSEDENGNYLVDYCDSPEVHVNGVWYYTSGTTYAQTFAYLNNYHALLAAKELGIDLTDSELLSGEEYSILSTILEQIDKYDPINVGLSGQIKEFREEDYYSSVGDDPNHRHVSQLVGLYPGNVINGTTPAWLDAARVTLEKRSGGNSVGGWVYAHKISLYARAKDREMAHEMVKGILQNSTSPNLFTKLWGVYQIDSSFGTAAGIAEMLLQSHEGYISPLAALPDAWSDGSYTGLVARGNFEVSAEWENGVAKTFNILSNNGGSVSVYYPSITGATLVRASDGKAVRYEVADKDIITFATEKGETYIISGFKKLEAPEAPTALNYSRLGFEKFNLKWTPSANAASYNVYVATENEADYILVANVKGTVSSYTPEREYENARTTFAVTAVSADGVESTRTLCYYNPQDTSASVENAAASVTANGALQVSVKANGNTLKYRLYEKEYGATEYVLIDESGFPLLYSESYNSDSVYAVAAVSYHNAVESELFEVKDFGSKGAEYDAQNIILGKSFVPTEGSRYAPHSAPYGYDKLTDGSFVYNTGRFSSKKTTNAANPMSASATIDLGGTYLLSEIRFYAYERRTGNFGTNFTLEVYSDGNWIKVVDNLSNEELAEKYTRITGLSSTDLALVFDFGGIKGSQIRFSADAVLNSTITWYEAECSGILLSEKSNDIPADNELGEYSDNILLKKQFEPAEGAKVHSEAYGYDKLTDGIISQSNGRYASSYSSTKKGVLDGTVDLGGVYSLSELRIYNYVSNVSYPDSVPAAAGDGLTLQVYSGGVWITLYQFDTAEELSAYYHRTGERGAGQGWVAFDLNNISAEKIRIYAVGSSLQSNCVTYYEIQCSGYSSGSETSENSTSNVFRDKEVALSPSYGENSNILYGKAFLPATEALSLLDSTSKQYGALTDGCIHNNDRVTTVQNGIISATADLGGAYKLSSLRLKWYSGAAYVGSALKINLYSDGQWKTAVELTTNADIWKHKSGDWLVFDLSGDSAEKIEIEITAVKDKQLSFAEIECSGAPDIAVPVSADDVSNVNDGKLDTVISVTGSSSYSLTFELGSSKALHTLRVYELIEEGNLIDGIPATASDNTTVEVFRNGIWLTVHKGVSLDPTSWYTEIELFGIECEKVRITFNNTRLFDGESTYKAAVIQEITCTEMKNVVDRSAMIEALEKLASVAGDSESRYLYDENYLKFKEYAADFEADQATVDGYAEEINAYYEELIQNPTYLVRFNYVYKNGCDLKPSVFKYIAANGEFKLISPAIDGYYTRDIYIQGKADTDGKAINAVYYEIPENADAEKVEKYLSDIVAWGDSITAGSGSNNLTAAEEYGIDLEALGSVASGANYVTVLENLIMSRIYGGVEVDGCGVGGEASSTITSRADTETYYLYLDGEVTIGTDVVTVPLTHYASGGRVGILRQGNDSHINPVTIKGYDADGNEISVVGKISMTLTDDAPEGTDKRTCDAKYLKYTFTRTDGGTDTLNFVSGARVITKSSYIYDGRTCIIFMGENGGYSDINELIKQQEEILNACGNPEYFLIISTTSGSNESRKELREALSARWGDNYINMGDELNSSRASYELAGYSKEVIDSVQTNIDEGTVTSLLLADRCHPNAVGYAVAGNIIFERLYDIGAFDAILDYYDCLNGVIEHSYDVVVTAPDCVNGGFTTHTCPVCGDSYVDSYTDALGHTYDDDRDADCNVCGEIREVASSTEGTCGTTATWRYENGVLYIEGTGSMNAYSSKNMPWIEYKNEITTVIVAEGIRSIGKCSFYECVNLTSITLPSTLRTINPYAFYGCSGLTEITLPASLTAIKQYAFRRSGLTSATFENDCGWYAGENKVAAAELSFEHGAALHLVKFGYKADWTRDTKAEPEIYNLIAMGYCGTNAWWTLDNEGTLTIHGSGVVINCTSKEAPWTAYKNEITKVVIGEGITKLGKSAFYEYANITEVVLPSTLTEIGHYAFYGCKGLTEVTIPASVTTIGSYVFRKSGVTSVIFENTEGWTYKGTAIDVSDAANVANLLNKVSYSNIWSK